MNHNWNERVCLPRHDVEMLTPRHKWYAVCLRLAPEFWTNDGVVATFFGQYGLSRASLSTLMSLQRCWRAYVTRFLNGETIDVARSGFRQNGALVQRIEGK